MLLVESAPRWEFKYLQALLLRDRRVQLKCVLQEIDPAISADPTGPYLPAFPLDEKRTDRRVRSGDSGRRGRRHAFGDAGTIVDGIRRPIRWRAAGLAGEKSSG